MCEMWTIFKKYLIFHSGPSCAMVFNCKLIETSALLQVNVTELFEGVVRQTPSGRGEGLKPPTPLCKHKEGITPKVRHFLDHLVVCNHQCMF